MLNLHGLYHTAQGETYFVKVADAERSSLPLVARFMLEPTTALWAEAAGVPLARPHAGFTFGDRCGLTLWDYLERSGEHSHKEKARALFQRFSQEGAIAKLSSSAAAVGHGAPHLGNLAATAERTYVVDWESVKCGPIAFDLGQFYRFFPEEEELVRELTLHLGSTWDQVIQSATLRAVSAYAHRLNAGLTSPTQLARETEWMDLIE